MGQNTALLADLLLRRKELEAKVHQLDRVTQDHIFQTTVKRTKITEDLDEVIAAVPRVSINQVTAARDWYAKQLRLTDSAIQRANWSTEVALPEGCSMGDYEAQVPDPETDPIPVKRID